MLLRIRILSRRRSICPSLAMSKKTEHVAPASCRLIANQCIRFAIRLYIYVSCALHSSSDSLPTVYWALCTVCVCCVHRPAHCRSIIPTRLFSVDLCEYRLTPTQRWKRNSPQTSINHCLAVFLYLYKEICGYQRWSLDLMACLRAGIRDRYG